MSKNTRHDVDNPDSLCYGEDTFVRCTSCAYAAVEERVMTRTDTMQDFIRAEPVVAAMRALLEGGE